jgi:hypothetical protein
MSRPHERKKLTFKPLAILSRNLSEEAPASASGDQSASTPTTTESVSNTAVRRERSLAKFKKLLGSLNHDKYLETDPNFSFSQSAESSTINNVNSCNRSASQNDSLCIHCKSITPKFFRKKPSRITLYTRHDDLKKSMESGCPLCAIC